MKLASPGALCLLALLGCGKPAARETAASATSSAPPVPSSAASTPLASVSAASPSPLPADPTCRALRVVGEAQLGEAALLSGAQLDGTQWVILGVGASVTLKHAATGREIALAGPALFRACRRGREQVLLAKGKVQAGSGMGSRPGAEVLIATPLLVARYADADFSLTLDDKSLSVDVRAGQLELDPAAEIPAKRWKSTLRAKEKLRLPLGKPDPSALMARCKQAAEAAEATARRVGDPSAPEPLGERAQVHVRARKAARGACTVAAAAIGLVADPVASAGLWAEAVRWEGLWETIPRRSPVQPAEK